MGQLLISKRQKQDSMFKKTQYVVMNYKSCATQNSTL